MCSNNRFGFNRIILTLLLLTLGDNVQALTTGDYPARCRVNTNLNVRSGSTKDYDKIGLLKKGEYIRVEFIIGPSNDAWGGLYYNSQIGYVSMRYVTYIEPIVQTPQNISNHEKAKSGISVFFAKVWKFIKWILIGIAVLIVLGSWEYIVDLAIYVGFFAGAGALIFVIFGGKGSTGAIVGLVVAAVLGIRLLLDKLDLDDIEIGGVLGFIFLWGYYILSIPFYWLNHIEHILVEPWRYLFQRDWVPDNAKPTLRVVLEVLSVFMYIATTPLRLVNAILYNILIHCVTSLYDLLFEVFAPCDPKEGAGNVWKWMLMFPWRLIKYPIYHGILTIIESIIWTVADIFIPAQTLYHGTSQSASDVITSDPHRNKHLRHTSDWSAGNFLASSRPECSWAGRGVYFAINRRLSISYARWYNDPVVIVCRVSMGRVINYTLAPHRVYTQAGKGGNHDELNKFADKNGYTTGEWFNDRRHWEYCLFDWQKGYNHPWRIRPIYVINLRTGLAQHVRGGIQHWLFYKTVLNDLFG